MKIGLIAQLHGAPHLERPAPTWESVSRFATTAEEIGFDSFVFEDALLYRGAEVTQGSWESVSIAAALAATTSRIKIGQSVINAPYRSPALIAKTAETLDEISGGRYLFGLGAGNTDDSDYAAFGFATDRRYSRFAEAIEIIHGLLKDGSVDFDGEFHFATEAELVLRGPRPHGPPIIIAAAGPRMLRLVARYADEWNWWTSDAGDTEQLRPVVEELELACAECDRDPASLRRSLDVYTVDPLGHAAAKHPGSEGLVAGSPAEIAEVLLGFGELGFAEVRCDVYPKTLEGVEAMADVVDRVHHG